jgi:hypothetical protein
VPCQADRRRLTADGSLPELQTPGELEHCSNAIPADVTRDRLIKTLRRVVPWAENAGAILALECHVTGSPWVCANLIADS